MKMQFESETASLFGDNSCTLTPAESENRVLYDKYIYPPLSVLDLSSDWFKKRVRKWKDLGIQSEVTRENANVYHIGEWAKNNTKNKMEVSDVSIFNPVLTELCYNWYCPEGGRIFDPYAGGSVRGIVASCCGYRYLGIDIREDQVKSNYEQANKICKSPLVLWTCADSWQYMKDMEQSNTDLRYNFIFSCPPYGNLEVYSDDPNDISNMPYEQFLSRYRDTIAGCYRILEEDSFAAFVVGEYRDKKSKNGKYVNFVGDTIDAFVDAGFEYYNEAIVVTPLSSVILRVGKQHDASRKIGKTHQNLLVFVKGSAKAAADKINKSQEVSAANV